MELKIISKKQDPLLSRTKVEAEISFDKATPSIAEVKSQLGKDLGKDEKLIVVKSIYTQYGLKKAVNLSYVYENDESLKRIEPEKKEKTGKKEAKAEEKPEAKKEEKQEKKTGQKPGKEAKQKEKQEEQKAKESKTEEKPKERKAPDKEKKQ